MAIHPVKACLRLTWRVLKCRSGVLSRPPEAEGQWVGLGTHFYEMTQVTEGQSGWGVL